MRSAQFQPYHNECILRSSPVLAAGWVALALLAVVALQWAAVPGWLIPLLSLLVMIVGGHAAFRFLRPRLRLRLGDDWVEYQSKCNEPWRRFRPEKGCFVSPWFIGWRDGRGVACAVFRGQLEADEFRRLSVLLRHRRLD